MAKSIKDTDFQDKVTVFIMDYMIKNDIAPFKMECDCSQSRISIIVKEERVVKK